MGSVHQRVAVGLALAGFVAGALGCGSGGGGGAGTASSTERAARVSAILESSTAARDSRGEELDPVDVAAVDQHGNKVDEALEVTGSFSLHLPWGRDYVLIFADAEGLLGAMVYGEREQSRFSVEDGDLALDLGQIVIDSKSRWVRLKDPRRVKPPKAGDDDDGDDDDDGADRPGPELGNAAVGAVLWGAHCAACHPNGVEETSTAEIAEVLREGEGSMPPFPDLVPDAADFAAYLRGSGGNTDTLSDRDGDGVSDDRDICPDVAGDGADGCPVSPSADADGDGVTDEMDRCPDVPAATDDGCPLPPPPPPPADADGDGVPDTADRCANTPAGVAVDTVGCPRDRDGDGVPDYLDACPTAAGAGADGCPVAAPTRPAILDTTCRSCHGDFSSRVSCTNSQWPRHNGARGITAAQYQAVSTWATGGTCP